MVKDENLFFLPDGRRLGYAVYGSPDGKPILLFHGIPGSRLQRHPDLDIVERSGMTIFAPDRPGIGLSDPLPHRTLLDWARDMRLFCQGQKWRRVSVIGVSGGGPYALACAYHLAGMVDRVTLISSLGPLNVLALWDGMTRGGRILFRSAARLPNLSRLAAYFVFRITGGRLNQILRYGGIPLPEYDLKLLRRKKIAMMLHKDVAEAFRRRGRGVIEELRVQRQPWGFELGEIRTPVDIWHGTSDTLVPPLMASYLAQQLPSARLHWIPSGGHFIALEIMEEIFKFLGD
jgi:pimeloyl-ACP methyl ester carboxylesterase